VASIPSTSRCVGSAQCSECLLHRNTLRARYHQEATRERDSNKGAQLRRKLTRFRYFRGPSPKGLVSFCLQTIFLLCNTSSKYRGGNESIFRTFHIVSSVIISCGNTDSVATKEGRSKRFSTPPCAPFRGSPSKSRAPSWDAFKLTRKRHVVQEGMALTVRFLIR